MDLLPQSKCEQMLGFHTVCARDNDNLEVSGCHGDSGSPLFCNGELIGIASFITGPCLSFYGNSTYYVDVHYYRNWILKNKATSLGLCNNSKYILFLLMCILAYL